MKKIMCLIVSIVCVNFLNVSAADSSEVKAFKSPLTTYSGGLGIGGIMAVNDELSNYSKNFLKVSFVNMIYFRDYTSFFVDLNWNAPGENFNADIGVDFLFTKSDVRPFVGAGIGASYFHKTESFGDNVGPSATLHAGCIFDLNDKVSIRFRVPVTVVMNETRDITAGADIGFLFSDKFKRVKKLDYNR